MLVKATAGQSWRVFLRHSVVHDKKMFKC